MDSLVFVELNLYVNDLNYFVIMLDPLKCELDASCIELSDTVAALWNFVLEKNKN